MWWMRLEAAHWGSNTETLQQQIHILQVSWCAEVCLWLWLSLPFYQAPVLKKRAVQSIFLNNTHKSAVPVWKALAATVMRQGKIQFASCSFSQWQVILKYQDKLLRKSHYNVFKFSFPLSHWWKWASIRTFYEETWNAKMATSGRTAVSPVWEYVC